MADNTDEEHLNNPPNTQSENSSKEIIPNKDTEIINPNQEAENMEVHHHAHHEGKKNWKSYFWEFLMLFLAVFCGFLAEYQLEHIIEHKREKQYVESMVHDIIEDTAKLSMIIDKTSKKANGIDSLLKNILATPYTDSSIKKMYGLTYYLSYRANMTFTKRTITQLKNSGGLRLIRNMEASDSIVVYDQACESAEKQFDVLYLHQLKARDLEYKIFDPRCRLPDNKNHKLLDDNVRLMMEYANWVSGTKYTHLYYGQLLKNLLKSATRTIEFLKKEYQLE